MRLSISDLSELLGLILIAVAVGALAGIWWGVGVGGVELVVLGYRNGAPKAPTVDA